MFVLAALLPGILFTFILALTLVAIIPIIPEKWRENYRRGTVILILITPLLCCVGSISVEGGKIGCGILPVKAREQFIALVIDHIIQEDYPWLVAISNEEQATELMALKAKLSDTYQIVAADNLGGYYQHWIRFDNDLDLEIDLSGVWPKCPDLWYTEQELLEFIELDQVSEINWRK